MRWCEGRSNGVGTWYLDQEPGTRNQVPLVVSAHDGAVLLNLRFHRSGGIARCFLELRAAASSSGQSSAGFCSS